MWKCKRNRSKNARSQCLRRDELKGQKQKWGTNDRWASAYKIQKKKRKLRHRKIDIDLGIVHVWWSFPCLHVKEKGKGKKKEDHCSTLPRISSETYLISHRDLTCSAAFLPFWDHGIGFLPENHPNQQTERNRAFSRERKKRKIVVIVDMIEAWRPESRLVLRVGISAFLSHPSAFLSFFLIINVSLVFNIRHIKNSGNVLHFWRLRGLLECAVGSEWNRKNAIMVVRPAPHQFSTTPSKYSSICRWNGPHSRMQPSWPGMHNQPQTYPCSLVWRALYFLLVRCSNDGWVCGYRNGPFPLE